jgi:diguanylate cyclase (GGDEF)-like protein
MTQISEEQRVKIRGCVEWYKESFIHGVLSVISHQIPSFRKAGELEEFVAGLDLLLNELINSSADSPLDTDKIKVLLPYLKRAVLSARLYDARNIEQEKEKTHNPDILKLLEDKLRPLDDLLKEKWLIHIDPIKVPRLIDYLSIQRIENHYRPEATLEEREYDEKFHILQAPKLFFSDLHFYRRKCEMRKTGLVVAYLDIDDFKSKFNSIYSEVEVDRRVLPLFMQTIERHIYHHGFAYRYGGDEYVLLIPNMSIDLAVKFLDLLRTEVQALKYRGIESNTTLSIGFCYVDLDCYLTDREIEERANKAKNFAKEHGKNRIATYTGAHFTNSDLQIVAPLTDKK